MPKWLVGGEPVRWRVMVMTQAGIFFSGKSQLERAPGDAEWFDEFDNATERANDIVALNADGITQVRIISSAF